MIVELDIKRFRGLRDLHLANLNKINIIAGANNTGKTSILEVIQSLKAPNSLRAWRMLGKREANSPRILTTTYDTINSLFPINIDTEQSMIQYSGKQNEEDFKVELYAKKDTVILSKKDLNDNNIDLKIFTRVDNDEYELSSEYETDVLEIEYVINNEYCGRDIIYAIQRGIGQENDKNIEAIVNNIVYISPMQHTQNTLYLNELLTDPDLYEEFVTIMQRFDPNFISINSIQDEKTLGWKYVILSKEYKEGLLLNAYGDGMKKAMLLISAVIRAKNGILLLDEFETAIHVSVMKNVFNWIIETADKLNVQIFMTSHSLEAIDAILKCTPNMQKDIRMITLVNVDNHIKVRNVSGEKAVQLLDEYGLELR